MRVPSRPLPDQPVVCVRWLSAVDERPLSAESTGIVLLTARYFIPKVADFLRRCYLRGGPGLPTKHPQGLAMPIWASRLSRYSVLRVLCTPSRVLLAASCSGCSQLTNANNANDAKAKGVRDACRNAMRYQRAKRPLSSTTDDTQSIAEAEQPHTNACMWWQPRRTGCQEGGATSPRVLLEGRPAPA
jgi:hypothetical protein